VSQLTEPALPSPLKERPMPAQPARATPLRLAAALAIPIVAGSLIAAAVAAITRAIATVPAAFSPFRPSSYISLIVLGVAAGAAGWLTVRRRPDDPAAVLRVLAPAVLLLSLVPDVIVGAAKTMAGTTWAGVLGLMAMHLIIAALAVSTFAKALPLPAPKRAD
jgi:hypothetical protein